MKHRAADFCLFRLLAIGTGLAALALTLIVVGDEPVLARARQVSGTVRDENGQPVAQATVRIKTTTTATVTDAEGRFTLSGLPAVSTLRVTAWKQGYYIAGASAQAQKQPVQITLSPYTDSDHVDYVWTPPAVTTRSPGTERMLRTVLGLAAQLSFERLFLPIAEGMELGCRDCHRRTVYDQWAASGHALGNGNPRFLSMYNGTDQGGSRSPRARRAFARGYGSLPARPDPKRPYYGPGYRLDFPGTAGTCATCHVPAAALARPYGTDPNRVSGVNARGSHCDFCHKIVAVKLDPGTGRPFQHMPGILSIELLRPGPERQLFFGPFDDVDVGPDTYLPLIKQSEICAPCHDASFWGVPIYGSFAEWRTSPYAAEGKTCQSCHMAPDGVTTNFAPGRGGRKRDPSTIASHGFPGAMDQALLESAVTLDLATQRRRDRLVVAVTVTNDRAGHHVPTGSPLRQLLLLVRASDEQGRSLPLIEGPTLPPWAGQASLDGAAAGEEGPYYAGRPGKAFAKVLEELWTKVYPTGAYWRPTRVLSDNRIPALGSDVSVYTIACPPDEDVRVEVELLFRRAFIELMEQKGWSMPDILMARQSALVPAED